MTQDSAPSRAAAAGSGACRAHRIPEFNNGRKERQIEPLPRNGLLMTEA